jgi:hypothetical protein
MIPTLHASLQWGELLHFRLVSDFRIDSPKIRVNLAQARHEVRDTLKLKDKGWQAAAAAIYPFKINLLRINDADIVYIDEDPSQPMHIAHLQVRAGNIRNIESKGDSLPSTIHAEGDVFEKGRATIDGHADFLAQPGAEYKLAYTLNDVPLDNLKSIAIRKDLILKGGTLASVGSIESERGKQTVHVRNAHIRHLRVDYTQKLQDVVAGTAKAAAKAEAKPDYLLVIDTVDVANSELGVTRQRATHSYRLYIADASVRLTNYSNHFTTGVTDAVLRGRFMGSGRTAVRMVLRPDNRGPDFDLAVAIDSTPLVTMNEMLLATASLDVTKGQLSFYSELSVSKGRMTGYVKPMFAGVKVYDAKQDSHEPVINQLYQLIVGGALKLFENHHTHEVATRATINGPSGSSSANVWEVIGNAFENAFVNAILPGLDRVGINKNSVAKNAAARPPLSTKSPPVKSAKPK